MTDSNAALDSARVNRHAGRSWLPAVLSAGRALIWALPAAARQSAAWGTWGDLGVRRTI